MSYWDDEMKPWFERVEAMPAPARLRVASGVLDHTVAAYDPPYEQVVDDATRPLVDRILARTREAVAAGRGAAGLGDPQAVADEIGEALEADPTIEADSLLMALLALVGPGDLTADQLVTILSSAYHSTLANVADQPETDEEERSCPPCREAVAVQQRLLREAGA
jgi:hypothetical protein